MLCVRMLVVHDVFVAPPRRVPAVAGRVKTIFLLCPGAAAADGVNTQSRPTRGPE